MTFFSGNISSHSGELVCFRLPGTGIIFVDRSFDLPAYAPELNPVEPVWSDLKRSLANLIKHDINQLTTLVKARLRQMQYRPGLLGGFLAKPGLDLGNFHN